MSDYGQSFVTRERAKEIAGHVPTTTELVVDFNGVVIVSPSFADEFVGCLIDSAASITIENLPSEVVSLVERVISRRGLDDRVRVAALA